MFSPLGSTVRPHRDKEAQAEERREGQRELTVVLLWCQFRGVHLTSCKETNPFPFTYSMAFLLVHPRVSPNYTKKPCFEKPKREKERRRKEEEEEKEKEQEEEEEEEGDLCQHPLE